MTFRAWLDSKKLTINDFCPAPGLDFGTVTAWSANPTLRPRKLYRQHVRQFYPDCPVAR